jgi:hypothetical protein
LFCNYPVHVQIAIAVVLCYMNHSRDWLLDGRQNFDSRQRRSFDVPHTACVSHPTSHAVRIRAFFTDNARSPYTEVNNLPSRTFTFPHTTLTWYLSFEKILLNLPQMAAYGLWTLRGSRVLQKAPRIYIISQHDMLFLKSFVLSVNHCYY